jgi:DNA-binding transcriptional ArsR family regulator
LPSNTLDERKVLTELRGNTLLVYWYLLRKRQNPAGVREVQRALGFSSSSTASYHLEKLTELGLVAKDSFGNYKVSQVAKVGIMRAFLFVGGFAFPKHLLYAIITSLLILCFILLFVSTLSLILMLALLPGIMAAGIFWYEAVTVWRHRPRL